MSVQGKTSLSVQGKTNSFEEKMTLQGFVELVQKSAKEAPPTLVTNSSMAGKQYDNDVKLFLRNCLKYLEEILSKDFAHYYPNLCQQVQELVETGLDERKARYMVSEKIHPIIHQHLLHALQTHLGDQVWDTLDSNCKSGHHIFMSSCEFLANASYLTLEQLMTGLENNSILPVKMDANYSRGPTSCLLFVTATPSDEVTSHFAVKIDSGELSVKSHMVDDDGTIAQFSKQNLERYLADGDKWCGGKMEEDEASKVFSSIQGGENTIQVRIIPEKFFDELKQLPRATF